jgi:hypothetical protein
MTMRITRLKATLVTCAIAAMAAAAPVAAQDVGGVANCCTSAPDLWPEDPNTTRLVFGPTARTLPKGNVALGFHGFVLPSLQVGITDRVSVGGGTPLLFSLGGNRPFWITPKIAVINHHRTQVAVGAVQTFNFDGLGFAYAVMTTGTPRQSVTAATAITYAHSGGRAVVLLLGGDKQVRRKMKLVTENYYVRGQGVLSAGVRFFDERKSLDAAIFAPINSYFYGLVPTLSFVYRFGDS